MDLETLLRHCDLNFNLASENYAYFQLATQRSLGPVTFHVVELGWSLRIRAEVSPCARPSTAQLRDLNRFTAASPLGISAAWDPGLQAIVLTLSFPRSPTSTPEPQTLVAAITSLANMRFAAQQGIPPTRELAEQVFDGSVAMEGLVRLEHVVEQLSQWIPLSYVQGGYMTALQRFEGAMVGTHLRLSHDPIAGLCVDTIAEGDPQFSDDPALLRAFSELNALLSNGAFAFWTDAQGGHRLRHRYALPLPWLALSLEGPSLFTHDCLLTWLHNGSAAWDDAIRICQGGPVMR